MAKAKAKAKPKAAPKQLTKAQIVDQLAKKAEGVTKKQTTAILDGLVELAYKNAKKGFTIPGLGKVFTATRKARTGRNPSTGESIKIPKKNVVKFRVSKTAQDAVYPTKK
jgi:DNA-binding protein HU-beta